MRKFQHTLLKVAIKGIMVMLSTIAFTGIIAMVIQLISNPQAFNNISFGIYN